MKIQGYFDDKYEPPAPFVRAAVISRSLGIEQAVDLHIDTGAATSILLDKDVRRLRVDAEKLKVAERSLVGIGGQVRTYVIDDATLVFRAENGQGIIEKLRLFVGVHDLDRLPPEQREIMLRLPSLLGRDIIYRAKLVLDKSQNEIYLDR